MRLIPRSIIGRLMAGLSASTVVVLTVAVVFLLGEVRAIFVGSVDNALHSKSQMVAGLIHEREGGVELELSEIIAGEYIIPLSGHYYRVTMDDEVMAASLSLGDDAFPFVPIDAIVTNTESGESFYTSTGPDDELVRVIRYRFQAFDKSFDITLAESLEAGVAMISAFKRYLLVFIPVCIVILCLTAWVIARMSLRPIASFTTMIESITHKNLGERVEAGATARELAGLAESFNALLDRLHTVFEGQKRLVADASHELKTPISVIRTQCDVVLQRVRTSEEYVEALRTIQTSSQGMTKLIGDLLSLARLDAGLLYPAGFTKVSLQECIDHAVEMTARMASERRIVVSVGSDEELWVLGSRQGLAEAVLNLLENAVRYNVEQGSVALVAAREDGKAVLTISDTGIGIQESDLPRVFERFYRAGQVRGMDGTGLGLSIVKFVVEAHNGEITVHSEPGKGSRFTVILPLAAKA